MSHNSAEILKTVSKDLERRLSRHALTQQECLGFLKGCFAGRSLSKKPKGFRRRRRKTVEWRIVIKRSWGVKAGSLVKVYARDTEDLDNRVEGVRIQQVC
jgi:hypothetical protein